MIRRDIIIYFVLTIVGLVCCSFAGLLIVVGMYDATLAFYLSIKDTPMMIWAILIVGIYLLYKAKLVGEQ